MFQVSHFYFLCGTYFSLYCSHILNVIPVRHLFISSSTIIQSMYDPGLHLFLVPLTDIQHVLIKDFKGLDTNPHCNPITSPSRRLRHPISPSPCHHLAISLPYIPSLCYAASPSPSLIITCVIHLI